MKTISIGLHFADENGNIVSKRQISGSWSTTMEYEFKQHHAADVKDQIAQILFENLKVQITPEMLKSMMNEAKEKLEDV